MGHLFQPFFIIVWCDCLFYRLPGPNQSLAQEPPESFHCHRVPDSFQSVLDSWKFVLEVHWTWSELHWYSISGVFSWKTGMGRFSWALQDPARNHPPWVVWNHMGFPSCIPGFLFVGSNLSWFYFMFFLVDDGSYWSTMVSGGLDLILHCWSAGTNCTRVSGRGLL